MPVKHPLFGGDICSLYVITKESAKNDLKTDKFFLDVRVNFFYPFLKCIFVKIKNVHYLSDSVFDKFFTENEAERKSKNGEKC